MLSFYITFKVYPVTSKIRNLIVTDKNTGEVLDRLPVYCPKKDKSLFSDVGFLGVSLNAAKVLSDYKIGETGFRVLLRIVSETGMDNKININQSDLAKQMGLARSNFNRSLKQLIELEIILEDKKEGKSKAYCLNPKYAWRGSTRNHVEALEEYENNINESTQASNVIETDAVTVTTTVTTTVQAKKPPLNNQN